ncbi:MAG: hypothetical protein V3U78_05030 [Thiotrichaceae bacterium]
MDNVLLISILLIFLTALISNVMKQRKRDRVLKEMQDFHITMQQLDGKQVWGRMRVYSNGLELIYSDPHKNSSGDMTSSYIVHQEDLDQAWVFYRFHNELSIENQERRKLEVENTIHPDIMSRIKRTSRNLLNAFNDAINEALGVFLNRLKGSGSAVAQHQDQYLKKVGASALGLVGNVFNPILERYINQRVVVVLANEKQKDVYCGFLKEYSPAWISLLDCKIKRKDELSLADVERMSMQRNIDMEIMLVEDDGNIVIDLLISYYGVHKLKLITIQNEESSSSYYRPIDQTISRKGSLSLRLDDLPKHYMEDVNIENLPIEFSMIAPERRDANSPDSPIENEVYQEFLPEIKLVFYTERIADVYIPRSIGVLRNGADFVD